MGKSRTVAIWDGGWGTWKGSSKKHYSQVWFHLFQWFRRRIILETLTADNERWWQTPN